MHAHLDQLLTLRDGAPIDADVRVHVQHCPQCLAEMERLVRTRDRLRSLPGIDAPGDQWGAIEAQMDPESSRRSTARIAAAAAVAIFAVAVGYMTLQGEPSETSPLADTKAIAAVPNDELALLIAQSRELEALLQYLPERPQVERVSTAATVDSIQQRIQWLDWQLANGSDGGLDRRQATRLWSERVDLMDSLVKVRYAESAPMVF